MGCLMLKHKDELKDSDFKVMLDLIIDSLKKRTKLWFKKIEALDLKMKEVISLFINKKIKLFGEVSDFIEGDNENLN
jgi:hypothetical protein